MISSFFLVVLSMSLCSSLNLPSQLSEEPSAGGRFEGFIEAEGYSALGSVSNITSQFLRAKRQQNAIGGHG